MHIYQLHRRCFQVLVSISMAASSAFATFIQRTANACSPPSFMWRRTRSHYQSLFFRHQERALIQNPAFRRRILVWAAVRTHPNLTYRPVIRSSTNPRTPMTRYETLTLLTCALRLAESFSYRSRPAAELSDWLERNPLGFAWEPDLVSMGPTQLSREHWTKLRMRLERAVNVTRQARPDALARNCTELVRYLNLSRVEADIFLISVRAAQGGPLSN